MLSLLLDLIPAWFQMVSLVAVAGFTLWLLPWHQRDLQATAHAWREATRMISRGSTGATTNEAIGYVSPDQLIPPPAIPAATSRAAQPFAQAPRWLSASPVPTA